jgi:hypothetical protein
MGVYHRVIKGTGNLKIKLIKNRQWGTYVNLMKVRMILWY